MEHKVYLSSEYFNLILSKKLNSVLCRFSREMQEDDILTICEMQAGKVVREFALNLDLILKDLEGLKPGYCVVLVSYFG